MKLIIILHARCAGVLFYWRWTTGSSTLTRDRLTVTLLIRNTSLEYLSLIYIPRSTNMRYVCPDLDIVNEMDNDKISEFTCIRFGSVAKLKCKNFVLKVVISKHIHCGWNHDKVFTTKLLLTLTRKQTLNIGQHLSKIMNVYGLACVSDQGFIQPPAWAENSPWNKFTPTWRKTINSPSGEYLFWRPDGTSTTC